MGDVMSNRRSRGRVHVQSRKPGISKIKVLRTAVEIGSIFYHGNMMKVTFKITKLLWG